MDYKRKYLKYKKKYLQKKYLQNKYLQNKYIGGSSDDEYEFINIEECHFKNEGDEEERLEEEEEEEERLEEDIKIDSITFELINKSEYMHRLIVLIKSVTETGEISHFYVYQSISDIGFWRLAHTSIDLPSQWYKGPDYLQSTLIDFRLQIHINKNINKLDLVDLDIDDDGTYYDNIISHEIPDNEFFKIIMSSHIFDKIKNVDRIIEINSLNDIIRNTKKCGLKPNKDDINQISKSLQENYEPDKTYEYKPLKYETKVNFDDKDIKIDGVIRCILLVSCLNEPNILLYYIDVNIKIEDDIFVNSFPLLATLEETQINNFGIYNNYIKLNSYICKIFDYKTQINISDLSKPYFLNNYVYLGEFYNNLFPIDSQYVEVMI